MQNNTLSGSQLGCITAVYIIGSSSVIGSSGMAEKDSWIAMALAIAAAIPLILLYSRVSSLYVEHNLFDMLYTAFGKKTGWLLSLAMAVYCFQLGALVLRDFPEFVHSTALPKTPVFVFPVLLGIICAYFARLGIASFGKAAVLFSWIVGIIVVLTCLFLIPNMELKHLRPVFSVSIDTIGINLGKLLSTPFGETVLLLCVFCSIEPHRSVKKPFLIGLLLGGGYLLISVLRNILVLGAENFSSLYFPSYSAVSTINIGDFFQRTEVMVAGYLLICDVLKISVAIYATCLGAAKLFKLESYKTAVIPVTVLMILFSVLRFDNIMQFYHWRPYYLLFSLPFQLVIPLALWLKGEAAHKKTGRENLAT